MLTTTQEVLFDLIDLADNNPELMELPIEGFEEFETFGEFIAEQRMKLELIEAGFEIAKEEV